MLYFHHILESHTALHMAVDSIPICERQYCEHSTNTNVLFAIKSPAFNSSVTRRNIIRNTFVRQIVEYPQTEYTFYLSRPDDENTIAIYTESHAHRDITIMTEIPETMPGTTRTGITLKLFEFLKHISQPYNWICHVDDDSYVQVYRLMERYLLNAEFHPFRTVIARVRTEPDYLNEKNFKYPGGQMFCMSWDITRAVAAQFHNVVPELGTDPNAWPSDDLVLGLFIHRAFKNVRWVDLPNPIAYDIGNSWNVNEYSHMPNPKMGINPHKMKDNSQYEAVALIHEQTYIKFSK